MKKIMITAILMAGSAAWAQQPPPAGTGATGQHGQPGAHGQPAPGQPAPGSAQGAQDMPDRNSQADQEAPPAGVQPGMGQPGADQMDQGQMDQTRPGPAQTGQPGQGETGQPGQGEMGQPGQGQTGQPGQGQMGQPGQAQMGQGQTGSTDTGSWAGRGGPDDAGMRDYPACSRTVTDRCMQTNERGMRGRRNR